MSASLVLHAHTGEVTGWITYYCFLLVWFDFICMVWYVYLYVCMDVQYWRTIWFISLFPLFSFWVLWRLLLLLLLSKLQIDLFFHSCCLLLLQQQSDWRSVCLRKCMVLVVTLPVVGVAANAIAVVHVVVV